MERKTFRLSEDERREIVSYVLEHGQSELCYQFLSGIYQINRSTIYRTMATNRREGRLKPPKPPGHQPTFDAGQKTMMVNLMQAGPTATYSTIAYRYRLLTGEAVSRATLIRTAQHAKIKNFTGPENQELVVDDLQSLAMDSVVYKLAAFLNNEKIKMEKDRAKECKVGRSNKTKDQL